MRTMRLLAVALLALVTMAPSSATEESTASCHLTWVLDFSPGIEATEQMSEWTSHGPTGTADCEGQVSGHEVTGEGTTGSTGIYAGSCAGGRADETLTVAVPTTGGTQHVTFSDVELDVGPGFGTKEHEAFVGPVLFVFVPTRGDCVTEPVTRITVEAWGTVSS